ncbi:MAG TPA: beta-N-acetylhexosaminidase [Burkholderiaceae bacterium]|nr:beta-N-acetylhexosaminidase [Burkholderiaceae bacterium]
MNAPRPAAIALGPVVVDVQGLALTGAERERLRHPAVGGVILFSRNFESFEQVRALAAQIHAVRRPPLLVCVDHEGGRVQRFRGAGFTSIAPMRDLGRQWDADPIAAVREATQIGRTIGSELLAAGVDLSFTPVLDLDHGRSGVIGDRAFHADPRVVTLLAKSLNHGLLLAGMANCGKHFPGHGFAAADSHVAVPVDERPLAQILRHDAAPYGWLSPALAAVMPAHVIYPRVDAKPAGFSRRWLQTILRRRLGFDGLIFSDDLTMEGAAVAGDIVERAHAALTAGCDMVLVCNRPDLADQLLARLAPPRNPKLARRLATVAPRRSAW